ncbi:MAG: OprO/OprP family phosphate-selective porin [Puniceicoccales bacterium]|jgi:phosphate-selective porin OprO/OprP|nr:OprO/OprP family phosphate-selective porin [Puniceicoccales bacterium]
MFTKNTSRPALATLTAAAFLAFAAAPAVAQNAPAASTGTTAASTAAETAALRVQVDALAKQVRELSEKQAALEKAPSAAATTPVSGTPAAPAATAPAPAAAAASVPLASFGENGIRISSADKVFSASFGLLLQADHRAYLDDSAPSRDGFLMRRIRLPFSAKLWDNIRFNVTPEYAAGDAAGRDTKLIDAWMSAEISPALSVRVGKFPQGVVLEAGAASRHFSEASFQNFLAPDRDIGLEALGTLGDGLFGYRVGLVNNVENNGTGTTNTRDLGDGDPAFAGRFTVSPFKNSGTVFSALAFSVGAKIGNQDGPMTAMQTNGRQTALDWGPLRASGLLTQISPGIEYYGVSPFSFAAELVWERRDVSGANAATGAAFDNAIDNLGWRVSAGYVLTGETATKAGVKPTSVFNPAKGGWGAFEVVARVSGYRADSDIFTSGVLSDRTAAKGAFAYGIGLNWYLNSNLRVLFNVEKTHFDGGRDGAATRDGELYFFTRVQLSF